MRANANLAVRMFRSLNDFIKHSIQSNHVSKGQLIYALQRHPVGYRYGCVTNAAEIKETLIETGSIEITCDKCYWNDNTSWPSCHDSQPTPSSTPVRAP